MKPFSSLPKMKSGPSWLALRKANPRNQGFVPKVTDIPELDLPPLPIQIKWNLN